jgi:hypothetical protein
MPWRKTNPVSERAKFVLERERQWRAGHGRVEVAELCRRYGVRRQTGYVWIRRYQDAGLDVCALAERSRWPRRNPRATTLAVEDAIVAMRKRYPTWGPQKLRRLLVERFPRQPFPGATTIAAILRRRGVVVPRARRRRSDEESVRDVSELKCQGCRCTNIRDVVTQHPVFGHLSVGFFETASARLVSSLQHGTDAPVVPRRNIVTDHDFSTVCSRQVGGRSRSAAHRPGPSPTPSTLRAYGKASCPIPSNSRNRGIWFSSN